jgi:hypothetical protein
MLVREIALSLASYTVCLDASFFLFFLSYFFPLSASGYSWRQ